MTDVRRLFERQAEWQRARRGLSWPEKVRMAEAMREAILQLRGERDERRHAHIDPAPAKKGDVLGPPEPSRGRAVPYGDLDQALANFRSSVIRSVDSPRASHRYAASYDVSRVWRVKRNTGVASLV